MLRGADVMLKARTGTGKTLAYLTPVVQVLGPSAAKRGGGQADAARSAGTPQWLASQDERLGREKGTHALIVVPPRELGLQVPAALRH